MIQKQGLDFYKRILWWWRRIVDTPGCSTDVPRFQQLWELITVLLTKSDIEQLNTMFFGKVAVPLIGQLPTKLLPSFFFSWVFDSIWALHRFFPPAFAFVHSLFFGTFSKNLWTHAPANESGQKPLEIVGSVSCPHERTTTKMFVVSWRTLITTSSITFVIVWETVVSLEIYSEISTAP